MASVVAKETVVAGMGTTAGGTGAAMGTAWTAPLLKVVVGLAMTGAVAAGGVSVVRHVGAMSSSLARAPTGLQASASSTAERLREPAVVETVRAAPSEEPVASAVTKAVRSVELQPTPSRKMRMSVRVATGEPTAFPNGGSFADRTEPAAPSEETSEKPLERSSLALETNLLRQAHIARNSGDAARSLLLLEEYARAWPSGILQDEATVERALALCALGRADDARRVAHPLMVAAPSSPLTTRLRTSCARDVP
jgi:hypothetical protein